MSTISRDHVSPLTMVPVPGPIESSWQVFGRRRFAATPYTARPPNKELGTLADWIRIGEIVLLQIQTGEMTGLGGYDSSMLVPVDTLRLTSDGVFGLSEGAWIVDRHHRHHPAARYWRAGETLSFGFTSHYDHMWELFRHTALGAGGENVIVAADEMISLVDIAGGMRVETSDGQVELSEPEIAAPCVEFTRFMTSRPVASVRELKVDREKLANGVRGFVVGIGGPNAFEVGVGDTLSVRAI